MRALTSCVAFALLAVSAIAGKEAVMKLSSPSFEAGKPIPVKFTGEGDDASPALKWEGAPAGVKSFALICDDPDAPVGTWVHWVIWNIPGTATELPENVDKKESVLSFAKQGVNSWPRLGYNGPMPPRGHGAHRYFFRLYALNTMLTLPAKANKKQLLEAMKGHVLAEAELMGTYERR
jgi:Raf kinase inhibitor-like YbhB/YbcL family protein